MSERVMSERPSSFLFGPDEDTCVSEDIFEFASEVERFAVDRPFPKILNESGMCIEYEQECSEDRKWGMVKIGFEQNSPLELTKYFERFLVVPSSEAGVFLSETRDELREQLGGVLKFSSVVVDSRPTLAREADLRMGLMHCPPVDQLKLEGALDDAYNSLCRHGAWPINGLIPISRGEPSVFPDLNLDSAKGYTITGVSSASMFRRFSWDGLRSEKDAYGPFHSMEGMRSNFVRSLIFEAVMDVLPDVFEGR